MGPLCVATEVFLIQVIYLVKNRRLDLFFWALFITTGILYSIKLYINVLQLISNCSRVIDEDELEHKKKREQLKS
jgi:predicted RNA-binding protein associated with RNAse of E/G family